MVAETGLEPASTDYEPVPGGFTTPVYSASNYSTGYGGRNRTYGKRVSETRAFPVRPLRKILFKLVDLARFERATSTFSESRSPLR